MALRNWWRRERVRGRPTSGNGASSLHLRWLWAGKSPPPLVEVGVDLTVLVAPTVASLYFWALQASFVDPGPGGRRHGAGHVGLQWHPRHPANTAVNWGGYAAGGGELPGSESPLPSARGNPNTRDFRWEQGRTYRLSIRRGDDGWDGLIDGEAVRTLYAPGDALTGVVVWSEVFARCDDPTTVVRWSGFGGRTATGEQVGPTAVAVNYQSWAEGGCTNTTADVDPEGILQKSNAVRTVRQDAVLPVNHSPVR
ncbi:MAG: hypothetical protein ACRD0G_17410 [Acidimicrobiales bacterium]